ncbi:hypothetical protein ACHAQA_007302 [Verticillium albo-atrum]
MASPPAGITLRSPSKYASASASSSPSGPTPPALDWLHRTWSVTHSTLAMWRTARNVRITYKPLPGSAAGAPRIDDLVEYEPTTTSAAKLKTVAGVDTAAGDDTTAWDWRGGGMLFFVTSHWEVLGWGERKLAGGGVERWAVTWFAPTLFTKEGVDVYCDRKEGISEEGYAEVLAALKGLEAKPVVALVEADMQAVEIRLPWLEGKEGK